MRTLAVVVKIYVIFLKFYACAPILLIQVRHAVVVFKFKYLVYDS